jgi:hypothetical protein
MPYINSPNGLTMYYYKINNISNGVQKQDITGKQIFKFNVKGNIDEERQYAINDSVIEKTQYFYNKSDSLFQSIEYNNETRQGEKFTYSFSKNNKGYFTQITFDSYYSDVPTYYQYDTNFNLIEEGMDWGQRLDEMTTYTYDKFGNETSSSYYSGNHLPLISIDSSKYDEHKLMVEHDMYSYQTDDSSGIIISNLSGIGKSTYSYGNFDSHGNWQIKNEYDEDNKPISMITRKIEYY